MTRRKTGRQWMARHLRDPFVQQARREGYRSRAAFKLMEIDDRERLLRSGAVVVDLGGAPGGWSQVCRERVGAHGAVVAVDILQMQPLEGVKIICGDVLDPEVLERVVACLPRREADLVISDMAPNLSGVRSTDAARMATLVELAAQTALKLLKRDGVFLVKVFHGPEFDHLLKQLRETFDTVVVRKPAASRSGSSETYLLARRPFKRDVAPVVTG